MLQSAFTVLNTPVTWLELWAFILAVVGIACNIRLIHWGWPLAAVSSVLYGWLFWHGKLYAEAGLQVFFIATSLWGWWQWLYGRRDQAPLAITRVTPRMLGWCVVAWGAGTAVLGLALRNLSDSPVPFADAFPTMGSLIAQMLLARKVLQNWLLWIAVNFFSIGLFIYKEWLLTAVLYGILIAIAVAGYTQWKTMLKEPR
jgi:nicotinamide mononucleotide transporter